VGTVPDANHFTRKTVSGANVDSSAYGAYTSGGTATLEGVAGVIPTKSLNLPDEYAFDEWGRRITYLVDPRATKESTCYTLQNYPTNNGTGGVMVQTKDINGTVNTTDSVMYAYISHGPDGHGAFPAQGSTVANRLKTGSTEDD